jgi:hypothetical protein
MTPSNGVVEGEGVQITLWPNGRQLLPWDYFRLARHPPSIGKFQMELSPSHGLTSGQRLPAPSKARIFFMVA